MFFSPPPSPPPGQIELLDAKVIVNLVSYTVPSVMEYLQVGGKLLND